jgi:hypothetical protein
MCDMIFSGVFERHPRLMLAIVEFELAWAPHVLSSMDYTYRERHAEAIYRFKDGMTPSDFFRRNVALSFQEDAVGVRLRDVIGVDNMMWGSDYPHSESTFPQSRKILAEILAGVPDDEQAKPAPVQISEFPTGDFGSNRQAVSVETDRPFRSKAAPRCGWVLVPTLANRRCVIHPILLWSAKASTLVIIVVSNDCCGRL